MMWLKWCGCGVELYLFSLSQPIARNPMAPENTSENHLLEDNPMRAGISVCFIHCHGPLLRTQPGKQWALKKF